MSNFDLLNYEEDETDCVFTFKNDNTTLGFVNALLLFKSLPTLRSLHWDSLKFKYLAMFGQNFCAFSSENFTSVFSIVSYKYRTGFSPKELTKLFEEKND